MVQPLVKKASDRPLGIVDLVGLGVGGTIGSGIFVVPAVAAGLSPALYRLLRAARHGVGDHRPCPVPFPLLGTRKKVGGRKIKAIAATGIISTLVILVSSFLL